MAALAVASCAAGPAAMACVVGNGMPGSCDEAAFDACLPGGANFDGTVTWNCGAILLQSLSTTKIISQDIVIDGGNMVDLSGASARRLFEVNSGVTLTLRDIRLFNGLAGTLFARGGAIFNRGTLIVDHVRFEANHATGSGSTVVNLAQGGAIYSDSNAILTITDSTFFNNGANTAGTGIGQAYGGALYNDSGVTATITGSTFNANAVSVVASNDVADYGGAIYSGATLTVTNSTFFNNTVSGANARGSGIFQSSGTATLTNCTIKAAGGPASSLHNFASTFTLTNTVLAGAPQNCVAEMGSFTNGGHNIDDGSSCGFTGTSCGNPMGTSFCNTDPGLDPAGLDLNGGLTSTIALCTDVGTPTGCTGASPAINAGDQTVCANTMGTAPVDGVDQRDLPRPGAPNPNCCIGAFEVQGAEPTETPTSTPSDTPSNTPTGTATATSTATSTATGTATSTATNTPTPQPDGADCSSGTQCVSTFCVDGVCCNTACDGPLDQCNLPGQVGVCSGTAAPAPAASLLGLMIGLVLLAGVAALALRRGTRSVR